MLRLWALRLGAVIVCLRLEGARGDVTSDCERPYIKEHRVEHHGCYLNWHICMDQGRFTVFQDKVRPGVNFDTTLEIFNSDSLFNLPGSTSAH